MVPGPSRAFRALSSRFSTRERKRSGSSRHSPASPWTTRVIPLLGQAGDQGGGQVLQQGGGGGREQLRGLVLGQVEIQQLQGQPFQPLGLGEDIVGGLGLLSRGESPPAQQVCIAPGWRSWGF